MSIGCIDCWTSASVANYVTLLIDSHNGSPTRDLYQATHQLASPRRTRSNEAFVVVTHQSLEIDVTDLQQEFHDLVYVNVHFITADLPVPNILKNNAYIA